jgi:hypothetical protein
MREFIYRHEQAIGLVAFHASLAGLAFVGMFTIYEWLTGRDLVAGLVVWWLT